LSYFSKIKKCPECGSDAYPWFPERKLYWCMTCASSYQIEEEKEEEEED